MRSNHAASAAWVLIPHAAFNATVRAECGVLAGGSRALWENAAPGYNKTSPVRIPEQPRLPRLLWELVSVRGRAGERASTEQANLSRGAKERGCVSPSAAAEGGDCQGKGGATPMKM